LQYLFTIFLYCAFINYNCLRALVWWSIDFRLRLRCCPILLQWLLPLLSNCTMWAGMSPTATTIIDIVVAPSTSSALTGRLQVIQGSTKLQFDLVWNSEVSIITCQLKWRFQHWPWLSSSTSSSWMTSSKL
jgi:hypothetical protein